MPVGTGSASNRSAATAITSSTVRSKRPATINAPEVNAGEEWPHRRIIVNLAGLGYINSAGLRVLLVAAKRLNADGGRLLLAAPGDLVGRVLDVSGFSGMLETCATTEEALARIER